MRERGGEKRKFEGREERKGKATGRQKRGIMETKFEEDRWGKKKSKEEREDEGEGREDGQEARRRGSARPCVPPPRPRRQRALRAARILGRFPLPLAARSPPPLPPPPWSLSSSIPNHGDAGSLRPANHSPGRLINRCLPIPALGFVLGVGLGGLLTRSLYVNCVPC